MKYVLLLFLLGMLPVFSQTKSCFDIARTGVLSDVQILYDANPKVADSIDERKSSMLILACYHGNDEVARFLMNKTKDIDYNSGMGTALMACVVKGKTNLAIELIGKNADVNLIDSNGETALIFATMFENTELVRVLLEHNADKGKLDKKGKTAFEYAVFSGNQEIINLLK